MQTHGRERPPSALSKREMADSAAACFELRGNTFAFRRWRDEAPALFGSLHCRAELAAATARGNGMVKVCTLSSISPPIRASFIHIGF